MASLNKVILIGNLVADPELKTTNSGLSVTSFRIGVQRRYSKDAQQQTDFINIVCWRQQAEFVTRYFSKGKPILVCGSLQSRNYTDKDGNQRTVYEVVADDVSFVERKGDGAPGVRDQQQPYEAPQYSSQHPESSFEDISSDDILPF